MTYTYIQVDETNIESEHICCDLSGKNSNYKKAWMKRQFEVGYTFIKLNERAKVFVDCIPAEYAFSPIQAEGYIYVNCLWVAGQYSGQGHAKRLLSMVEEKAKKEHKKGVVFVCQQKKKPYKADPKFLMKQGYEIVDTSGDDVILCKSFSGSHDQVRFLESVHTLKDTQGFVIYYSHQCVFTEKYVSLLKEAAQEHLIDLQVVWLEDAQQVQQLGVISSIFSLYHNGQLLSSEILTVPKFLKIVNGI